MSDELINVETPKGVSTADVNLLIFIPCYGGLTYHTSNDTVMGLMLAMLKMGIRGNVTYGANESLIPRMRNRAANIMLDGSPDGTPYTHLLFLDADIGANVENILQMIGFDKDIVGLPYTAKDYQWDKIVKAVQNGITDPVKLQRCGGRAIINTEVPQVFDPGQPLEVPQLGTGCLLIKRRVFEGMAGLPGRKYKLMEGEKVGLKEGRDYAYDFFQIGINPRTNYYDSEDYRFCLDAREAGFETWLLPWAVTSHSGPHTFVMDILMQAEARTDEPVTEASPA